MTPCCALQLREKYVKDEDLSDTKATYRTIRKALATLDDPFTRFLEPQQFAALRRGTAGSVTGVGLEIGFENRGGDSNKIVVRSPTNAFQYALITKLEPAGGICREVNIQLHPVGSCWTWSSQRLVLLHDRQQACVRPSQ